jgi:hypothetical protein
MNFRVFRRLLNPQQAINCLRPAIPFGSRIRLDDFGRRQRIDCRGQAGAIDERSEPRHVGCRTATSVHRPSTARSCEGNSYRVERPRMCRSFARHLQSSRNERRRRRHQCPACGISAFRSSPVRRRRRRWILEASIGSTVIGNAPNEHFRSLVTIDRRRPSCAMPSPRAPVANRR